MQTFRIHLDTAYKPTATPEELTAAFATISTAGGKDVTLLAHTPRDRPRAEFSLRAEDRTQAILDVGALLASLLETTPAVFGGWTIISLRDRTD